MECPRCKHAETSVIDSRDADEKAIRRRRVCDHCQSRFTTYERIEPVKWSVEKRDGTLEPYCRDKIVRGLLLATEKRSIASAQIEEITDRIESKIWSEPGDQISSKRIGEWVIRELRRLDHVAYLRFASVYRSFASLEAFENELAKMKAQTER